MQITQTMYQSMNLNEKATASPYDCCKPGVSAFVFLIFPVPFYCLGQNVGTAFCPCHLVSVTDLYSRNPTAPGPSPSLRP